MKKLIFSFAVIALSITACQDNSDELTPNQEIASVDMSDFYVYTDDDSIAAKGTNNSHGDKCSSMKVLNRQLKENPGLENRMFNIEKHTRTFIAYKKDGNGGGGKGGNNNNTSDGTVLPVNDELGTINIPVYIYVVYSESYQNISDERINSQITVLNNDFNDLSYDDIPAEFQGVAADVDINFTLATTDRRADSTFSWGTNDSLKNAYPAVSGHLTIWVANIGSGILGYAQFPGGNASTDGIVVDPVCFGTEGNPSTVYGTGRTATHEVGHWLNLRHIWGDGKCGQDDFAADTPRSDGPNYKCPTYPTVGCKSNEMTMNYMDYTYGACQNMFSKDQKNRMRAVFADGGPRASLR